MLDQLDSWAEGLPATAFVGVAFLAAMIEYLFPPFPGDSVTVLAGVYAWRGDKPFLLTYVAILAGSLLGASIDYAVGRSLAHKLLRRGPEETLLGVSQRQLLALTDRMRRSGTWLLVGNRFLPAVRGPIFAAAGAAELPFLKVFLLGAVSTLAWNALLFGAGVAVGGNLERLRALLRGYERAALFLLGLALLAVVVKTVLSRRART
jgi:membrane protein DedA with SNARE-associated domain